MTSSTSSNGTRFENVRHAMTRLPEATLVVPGEVERVVILDCSEEGRYWDVLEGVFVDGRLLAFIHDTGEVDNSCAHEQEVRISEWTRRGWKLLPGWEEVKEGFWRHESGATFESEW